jgi:RNA polymerase sigma-70 factor (ECF subfamily)
MRADIGNYHDALIGLAYRITSDMESAKDIVQDTYITALKTESAFKGFSSLKTYLYRIVINKSIDVKRRNKRWFGLFDTLNDEPDATWRNVDEEIDRKNIVSKVMKKLPEEFRVPMVLAEVDGLSYEEIAETLQISVNTVRTRIFRCREKMRKELCRTGLMP